MAGIVIKPRSRIFHGHEWVYGTEVKKVFGNPQPGDVISLKDFKDRALGTAIYNPASQIIARRFSRRKQKLDQDFFERRLQRAAEYRERIGVGPVHRLIWSESDGLPGVIVDRYRDQISFQTQTLGMDQRKGELIAALESQFSPAAIIERNDSPMRVAEGMQPEKGVVSGSAEVRTMDVGGISLTVDCVEGQKTGLYLDQVANYAAVGKLCAGKRVLDCFSNQGGFALHAAKAGAAAVEAIDSSAPALELAANNAAAMNVDVTWTEANVFDFLKQAESDGKTWDLIILDPPSFAKNRKSLQGALRGYKEIHLRALKMLEPGGQLATFVCSHHVSREIFSEMIRDAAVDAKRTVRVVETYRQNLDHPILPTLPESEYLHGFCLEVMPAW